MNELPKILLSRRFKSFEELAALVVAWNLDFRQVSESSSDSCIEQIQAGNILFSHLSCGCFATHAGETPKNMYTIAVPDARAPEFRYSGRQVDKPALIIARPGQEFDVIARPGYGMSTFSIPQSVLEEYFESNFNQTVENFISSRGPVMFADRAAVTAIRELAQVISDLALQCAPSRAQPAGIPSFEAQTLECLLGAFNPETQIRIQSGAARQNQVFACARKFVKDHRREFLSVRELARAINVTERTLQRTFNHEFGISPKKFLFGRRMYGAHRQLWRSNPSGKSVVDIANAWGFWHMGQFAKDYRRLFGELPSETLRRSTDGQKINTDSTTRDRANSGWSVAPRP